MEYSLVPVKLEQQHDDNDYNADEWGRKRRSAFLTASMTLGREAKKEKKEEEDEDYLPVTAKPTPKRKSTARRQRGKARAGRRGQAEAAPSDELQEGTVIAVLTELVSLTDSLYAILPDSEDEEETTMQHRNKRRRTSACYYDDDGDADQATEYVGSSVPLAPMYDDTEYDDEHKSQQLERYEEAFVGGDDDEVDEDESVVARYDECEEDEVFEHASTDCCDSELPLEGNDLFEDTDGACRLWEASDDHRVYVSSESLRMAEQQQQNSEDEGEEPDVDETSEAVVRRQQSADHVDASGMGWITLKREQSDDEQAATLFLSWPLVAQDMIAEEGSMAAVTTLDNGDDAWLDQQLLSDGSLSGLHPSWLSFLSPEAPPSAAPPTPAGLSCEEELSEELLPNGADAVSRAAAPEESCTIAESWWTTVFV
jgi:hypothetical protein